MTKLTILLIFSISSLCSSQKGSRTECDYPTPWQCSRSKNCRWEYSRRKCVEIGKGPGSQCGAGRSCQECDMYECMMSRDCHWDFSGWKCEDTGSKKECGVQTSSGYRQCHECRRRMCRRSKNCHWDPRERKCKDKGPKPPVENVIIFEENGKTYEQKHSYNHHTRESVITVPAHGDLEEHKFILQHHGKERSSNSPVAGKMIVSSKNACSLEDIPAEINPEQIQPNNNRRAKDTRQMEEVTIYRINHNSRIATTEEQAKLSETMTKECEGKMIFVSSIEAVTEDEYLARSNYTNVFGGGLQRLKDDKSRNRKGCSQLYYGCATHNETRNCVRWEFNATDQQGARPLIVHYRGHEDYCTTCCNEADTLFLQCSCITDKQKFSTAFAISRERAGFGYDCVKKSKFCKWDPQNSISDCNYTTRGSCIRDSSCPMTNCATQDECDSIITTSSP